MGEVHFPDFRNKKNKDAKLDGKRRIFFGGFTTGDVWDRVELEARARGVRCGQVFTERLQRTFDQDDAAPKEV